MLVAGPSWLIGRECVAKPWERNAVDASHAVLSFLATSLMTPCWVTIMACVVASWVRAVAAWVSLHPASVHVPQNKNQQHMLSGTPVSQMSNGMLLPPSQSTQDKATFGTFYCAISCSFASALGRVRVCALKIPVWSHFGLLLSHSCPCVHLPVELPLWGLSSLGVSG